MLDFVAPGVRVSAASSTKNGTSQASPHVAGAIALLQGAAVTDAGQPLSPDDLLATMRIIADTRRHNDLAYPQLDLSGGPPIRRTDTFVSWVAEQDDGQIPTGPTPLEQTFTIEVDGLRESVGLPLYAQ